MKWEFPFVHKQEKSFDAMRSLKLVEKMSTIAMMAIVIINVAVHFTILLWFTIFELSKGTIYTDEVVGPQQLKW